MQKEKFEELTIAFIKRECPLFLEKIDKFIKESFSQKESNYNENIMAFSSSVISSFTASLFHSLGIENYSDKIQEFMLYCMAKAMVQIIFDSMKQALRDRHDDFVGSFMLLSIERMNTSIEDFIERLSEIDNNSNKELH